MRIRLTAALAITFCVSLAVPVADAADGIVLAPARELPRSPLAVDRVASTVDLPEARGYLRAIATRLLAASGGSGAAAVQADLFLTSDGFGASAQPTGDVLVGIGLLTGVETEDAVAFVLAHELAHLSHGHLGDERRSNEFDSAVRKLLGVLAAAQEIVLRTRRSGLVLAPEDNNTLQQAIAALTASIKSLQAIQTGVLAHAFNREQELEADTAALAMMAAAGYNADAALDVIAELGGAQKQIFAQTADAIRDATNAAKIILKIGKKYRSLGVQAILPFDPTDLLVDVAGESVIGVFCEFAATHPTAEKRREKVEKLLSANQAWTAPDRKVEALDRLKASGAFRTKLVELQAANAIVAGLSDAMVKRNPVSERTGCNAGTADRVAKTIEGTVGGLFKAFGNAVGVPAEEPIEHKPTVDISADLADLGKKASDEIRAMKSTAKGSKDPTFAWAAFAEVRAAQERYKDAAENLQSGLRTGEAVPLLERKLALIRAMQGDHAGARATLASIVGRYGAG